MVEIEQQGSQAVVRPRGAIDVGSAADLYEALVSLAQEAECREAVLDLGAVDHIDSSGIAVVAVAQERLRAVGKGLRVINLAADQREAFSMMPARPEEEAGLRARVGMFGTIGAALYGMFNHGRAFLLLAIDTLVAAWRAVVRGERPPRGSYTEQAVAIGVDALPIVALLSLLLGLILAFQAAFQLRQFGANIFVADLVGISMVREFGPMMTGIMLAGRSGSAIAAELGTMVVQEEVDALKTMGIDPRRFLVLPKMLGILTMQPALTLLSNFIGIFGGFVIAVLYLDLSPSTYIDQTLLAVTFSDWLHGLLKSVVFALLIGMVGCYSGLQIEGGASGVGRATTRAVVAGIFLIILADSIFAMVTTFSKPS